MSVHAKLLHLLIATLALSGGALATPINDPVGDLLPSYTGIKGGDLDVVKADVTLIGNNSFNFFAQLNGTIGTTPGAVYVFGLDRGAGTARFGALAPGVFFDSVVVVNPNGTGVVNLLVGGGPTNFAVAPLSGNAFSFNLPATLLPSLGRALSDFGWNLWPRNGLGNNAQIADFAPDNSTPRVSVVPEPATVLLFSLGSLIALRESRQRNRASLACAA